MIFSDTHNRSYCPPKDRKLVEQVRALCADGTDILERSFAHIQGNDFYRFVAADHPKVYRALRRLEGRAVSFLEWGSGTGVVTIMAAMLGFEAYGIEIDPGLVEGSRTLASKYGTGAQFAEGSFIPREYEWNPETGDENFRTVLDGEPGYEELDMELRDFDLVYAYPWPDEGPLYDDIMRRCGRTGALLLTFSASEGMKLTRPGRRR